MSVERKARRALDESTNLGSGKVLREHGEFADVDIATHDAVRAHLARVDREDLNATGFVRKRDLNVHLESSGSKERLVDHVESVRHADDEYIVQLVHTIHLHVVGQLRQRYQMGKRHTPSKGAG